MLKKDCVLPLSSISLKANICDKVINKLMAFFYQVQRIKDECDTET